MNGGLDVLHGVANGEGFSFKADGFAIVARSPSGVDIDFDGFFWVFVL